MEEQKYFYDKELERIEQRWGDSERTNRLAEQYLTQGFSDEDTWCLSSHLAELILPRLKRYKEIACIKIDFPLDDMIAAFEIYKEVEYDTWKLKDGKWEVFQKGMKAFGEHYLALWW